MTLFNRMFHEHPAAAGESYFEHMFFAVGFSRRLMRAALAALAHGFVPSLCETTASSTVLDLNEELIERRAVLARGRVKAGEMIHDA